MFKDFAVSVKPYAKFIAAFVAAVVVAGAAAKDGVITSDEVFQIVAAFSGSGAVYAVRNKPEPKVKAKVKVRT